MTSPVYAAKVEPCHEALRINNPALKLRTEAVI